MAAPPPPSYQSAITTDHPSSGPPPPSYNSSTAPLPPSYKDTLTTDYSSPISPPTNYAPFPTAPPETTNSSANPPTTYAPFPTAPQPLLNTLSSPEFSTTPSSSLHHDTPPRPAPPSPSPPTPPRRPPTPVVHEPWDCNRVYRSCTGCIAYCIDRKNWAYIFMAAIIFSILAIIPIIVIIMFTVGSATDVRDYSKNLYPCDEQPYIPNASWSRCQVDRHTLKTQDGHKCTLKCKTGYFLAKRQSGSYITSRRYTCVEGEWVRIQDIPNSFRTKEVKLSKSRKSRSKICKLKSADLRNRAIEIETKHTGYGTSFSGKKLGNWSKTSGKKLGNWSKTR